LEVEKSVREKSKKDALLHEMKFGSKPSSPAKQAEGTLFLQHQNSQETSANSVFLKNCVEICEELCEIFLAITKSWQGCNIKCLVQLGRPHQD
jgi:hypothetical protein